MRACRNSLRFCKLAKQKKTGLRPHLSKFTKNAINKRTALLSELPGRAQERQSHINLRNEQLAATQAYNLNIEKRRAQSHITSMPNSLQTQAAMEYVGDLDRREHRLAKAGLPQLGERSASTK